MVRLGKIFVCLGSVLLGLSAVIAGCESSDIFIGSDCMHDGKQVLDPACCPCPLPEDCPNGPKPIPAGCPNAPAPDGGTGGNGGTSSLCNDGACVSEPPDDWMSVAFFSDWSDPPICPEDTPILAFEGTPAPPPPTCGACSCGEPDGTCKPPATWTISSAPCSDPAGGVKINFDPPTNWDGSCNQDKSFPLDMLCGGSPCVRSMTLEPPVIEEQPCTPHTSGDSEPPPPKYWPGGPETPLGRVCMSDKPWPTCVNQTGKVCGPAAEAYASCIFREGEHLCPEGWEDRHLLYGAIDDGRTCSACTCDPPTGGVCQVKWHTFAGAACTAQNAELDIYAGMIPPCNDYMPGVALAGKSAELIAYTKGTCAPSGGEVVGDLSLDKPATVCCALVTS